MSKLLLSIARYLVQSTLAVLGVLVFLNGLVWYLGLNWRVLTRLPDQNVGVSFAAGTVVRWGREGLATTHYSADGEVRTPHDEGVEILVIGDSNTEGHQVDDAYKYVSVAEADLWSRGRRVNLRNMGHRGLSFADYVYWMPALLKRNPAPKAIVLQLSDVSFETSLEGNGANYFRKTENGSLELVHRAPDPSSYEWENPWWSYIRLFDYAEDRIYRFRTRARHGKSVKADPPLPDETVPLVTAQAKMLAAEMSDIPVLILRTPAWPYVDPPDDHAYTTFRAFQQVYPWHIIDPGPEMVEYIARTHRDPRTFANWLPMDGHLNREGNAIVGHVLARAIEKEFF